MTVATADRSKDSESRRSFSGREYIFLALACLVCAAAISSQSLWIDEAYAALKAVQPNLHEWWRELVAKDGSDLQMPLYMLWLWVCEKVFGSSEVALRGVNALWFVPGFLALLRVMDRNRGLQMAVFLTILFSPFAWYYLNEARPYAMQLGAALFALAALCHWNHPTTKNETDDRFWVWSFALAVVLLSGASLLGMVWAGAGIMALAAVLPKERRLSFAREYAVAWSATAVLLAGLCGYYMWTLTVGARATSVATTDWKTLLFVVYELTGFSGIGPGRIQLRDLGVTALRPLIGWVGVYAIVVSAVLIAGLTAWSRSVDRRRLVALTACLVLPVVFLVAVGVVANFRLLGRHFAPLSPVVALLFASGLSALWQRRAFWKKGLVAMFIALNLFSCLALRFAPRHAKDDYRAAATVARAALEQGRTIWWNAAAEGAEYYHVPIANAHWKQGEVVPLVNPTQQTLSELPSPDVVIASKRDIYDAGNTLARYLATTGFVRTKTLAAFTIWERGPVAP